MLTGALAGGSLDRGDFRATAYPRFMGEARDANLALVEALAALAHEKGCTAGQLALAWVLAQGPDIVPIPGTKRVKYLEENTAAQQVVLEADDLAAIEAAVPTDAVVGDRYADMRSVDR
jgi:aryl-alcohol dehydrogenase-like predicted oxidoreductase